MGIQKTLSDNTTPLFETDVSRRRFGSFAVGGTLAAMLASNATAAGSKGPATLPVSGGNAERFRQLIERGFNKGDLSITDEICAQKIDEHQYMMPRGIPGPQSMKNDIMLTRKSLKQLVITVEDIVESDDKVWARTLVRGTESTTGKPIVIDCIDIMRFKDGKIVEHWGVPDRFAMLHQAGLLPPSLM